MRYFFAIFSALAVVIGISFGLMVRSQSASEPDSTKSEVPSDGSFGGIGARLAADQGGQRIVATIPGSPAEKAGLAPGDKIAAIDGNSTRDILLSEACEIIQGDVGTAVTLTVVRRSTGEKETVRLTRSSIDGAAVSKSKQELWNDAFAKICDFEQKALALRLADPPAGLPPDFRKAYLDAQKSVREPLAIAATMKPLLEKIIDHRGTPQDEASLKTLNEQFTKSVLVYQGKTNSLNEKFEAIRAAAEAEKARAAAAADEWRANHHLGVTMIAYQKMEEGMGVWEVDSLIGQSGKENSSAGSLSVHSWNDGFKIITATFEGGKLVAKSQVGL
jgi:hypothetical protein